MRPVICFVPRSTVGPKNHWEGLYRTLSRIVSPGDLLAVAYRVLLRRIVDEFQGCHLGGDSLILVRTGQVLTLCGACATNSPHQILAFGQRPKYQCQRANFFGQRPKILRRSVVFLRRRFENLVKEAFEFVAERIGHRHGCSRAVLSFLPERNFEQGDVHHRYLKKHDNAARIGSQSKVLGYIEWFYNGMPPPLHCRLLDVAQVEV
jgi:hypothetical protein